MTATLFPQILNFIEKNFFVINMFPLILIYASKINKRNCFALRVAAGFLACIFLSVPLTRGAWSYFIQFSLFVLVTFFLYSITFKEALYCTACAYTVQHICYCAYLIIFRPAPDVPIYSLYYILCAAALTGLLYFLIGRHLPENGRFEIDLRFSLLSFILIIFLVLVLSIITDNLNAQQNIPLYYMVKLYDLICCLFVLWEQAEYKTKLKRQREQDMDRQLRIRQKELYRLRKDDVERINMLCHDLKKQVESLKLFSDEDDRKQYYDQVSQTIQSYDSQLETGSKVLDILLSQKRLICLKNNIELTCIADGEKLDFISAVDLYTILGNAIDNAIESVLLLADPDKKVISLSIWTKGQILLIQLENYIENDELRFSDGLPVTTKDPGDGHGFGLKSMRRCVEKYDGSMDVSAENHVFKITIFIPLSNAKTQSTKFKIPVTK